MYDGEHVSVGGVGGDELGAARQPDPALLGATSIEVDADEIGDVAGTRLLAELRQPPGLHDPAALDHHDLVAQRHGVDGVVRDHDPSPRMLAEMTAELAAGVDPGGGVERGEGLVEQQDARLQHERAGERDPLRLPSAQRPRSGAGVVGHADALEPCVRSPVRLAAPHTARREARTRRCRARSCGGTARGPGTRTRPHGARAGSTRLSPGRRGPGRRAGLVRSRARAAPPRRVGQSSCRRRWARAARRSRRAGRRW